MIQLQSFKTLIDLLTYFKDEQVCRDYLEMIRWNGSLECPYEDCGHNKVFRYTDGKRYKCAACKRQYSVKVGTIFEDSKIPLQKWFAAIYPITSHKKGISSLQLHRDLGVTQKTAWYMNHRVRYSFRLKIRTKTFRSNRSLSTVAKQLSYKSLTEDEKKEIRWFNDISKSNIGLELKQGSFGF